jgi:transcriptional regulator with XRE-family HTH domain
MNKAELARQLGISRAYATMLANGDRQPSKRLHKKIEKLTGKSSLSNVFSSFTRKRSQVKGLYRPH